MEVIPRMVPQLQIKPEQPEPEQARYYWNMARVGLVFKGRLKKQGCAQPHQP